MVLTPSTMMPLETAAPDFTLTDVVSGKTVSLSDFSGPLFVMFICRHCPYVQHIKKELARLGKDYQGKVGMVAISSNDADKYPDDSPEKLKEMAQEEGFLFPLCYDETQDVAKSYTASCTPDFFLFDSEKKLVYRGQIDDSRPDNGKPLTGRDIRNAMDNLLAGKEIDQDQMPSIGCNIKWKKGNEPSYFGKQ